MAKSKDAELVAMTKSAEMLGELDQAARTRVMRWLNEKFPAVEVVEKVQAPPLETMRFK